MHRVLERQLIRYFGNLDAVPKELEQLIRAVSETYDHYDQDRSLLERSLELSSTEMIEINSQLRTEIQKVSASTEELREAKAKDDAFLASIGDGLIAVDQMGMIVVMNDPAAQMFRLSSIEAVGKRFNDLFWVEDDRGVKISEDERPIVLALKTGKRISISSLYYATTNTRFPVAVTISPILLRGKVIGAIGVFRDITRERDIDRAKSEFVSLASHQLRTPLSTINWYTEMLLDGDGGPITPEQKEYLNAIYTGSKRMVDLVNALLDVSRIELGTFSIDPEPVDLVEMTKSLIFELTPQIQAQRLNIEMALDDCPKVFQADKKLMRVILQNFLTNSIKYTPSTGSVKIEIKKQEPDLLIKVSDTGYGVPDNQKDKIFTKLFRADNVQTKDTEGTGLGLYIVKSIVDHAGGRTWFDSVENKGSSFYATIPLSGMRGKVGTKKLGS